MYGKEVFILLTTAAIFLLTTAETKAVERSSVDTCNSSGMCKYGGKCDEYNTCRCHFNCNPQSWETIVYCAPTKAGRQRKYYMNLCQVLAHACERQEDIPLIKYNFATGRCEDEVPPTEKLCPNPEDFMGPCGGNTGMYGSIGAGICLQETGSHSSRCECPAERTGRECQAKMLNVRSVRNDEYDGEEKEDTSTGYVSHVAVYSAVCAVMFVVLSALLIKRYKSDVRRFCGSPDDVTVTSLSKDNCVKVTLNDSPIPRTKSCRKPTTSVLQHPTKNSNKYETLVLCGPSETGRTRLLAHSVAVMKVSQSQSSTKKPTSLTMECERTKPRADDGENNNSNNNNKE